MVGSSSLRGKNDKDESRARSSTNQSTTSLDSESSFSLIRRASEPIAGPSEVTLRGLTISAPVQTTLPSGAELYPNGIPGSGLLAQINDTQPQITGMASGMIELNYICTNFHKFVTGHMLERGSTLKQDERCKGCGLKLFDGRNNEWKKWILFVMSETEKDAAIRHAVTLERQRRVRELEARVRGEVRARRIADYGSEERRPPQGNIIAGPSYQEHGTVEHRYQARGNGIEEQRYQQGVTPGADGRYQNVVEPILDGRVYSGGMVELTYQILTMKDRRRQEHRVIEHPQQNQGRDRGLQHFDIHERSFQAGIMAERRRQNMLGPRVQARNQGGGMVEPRYQYHNNSERRHQEDRRVNERPQNQRSENRRYQEQYRMGERNYQNNSTPESRYVNQQINAHTHQDHEVEENIADNDGDSDWQSITTENDHNQTVATNNSRDRTTTRENVHSRVITAGDDDDDELYHHGNPNNPRYYCTDPEEDLSDPKGYWA